MKQNPTADSLHGLAAQSIPENTDLWPQVRARVGARGTPTRVTRVRLRRVMFGLSVAALLALLAAGASSLWNTATPVSAQAILEQAQASAVSPLAAVRTYH